MTTKYVMDRRLQLSFCDMAIVFHRLNSSYSKLSLISRIFKFFILINYFYDWSQLSGVFLFITLILLAMKDFQKCILGSLTFSHYREIFSRLCAASGLHDITQQVSCEPWFQLPWFLSEFEMRKQNPMDQRCWSCRCWCQIFWGTKQRSRSEKNKKQNSRS